MHKEVLNIINELPELIKGKTYRYKRRVIKEEIFINMKYLGIQKRENEPKHVFVNLDFGTEKGGSNFPAFGLDSKRLKKYLTDYEKAEHS